MRTFLASCQICTLYEIVKKFIIIGVQIWQLAYFVRTNLATCQICTLCEIVKKFKFIGVQIWQLANFVRTK